MLLGRSWKASELRLKSWDDLNKLWYVLLKEKNMLMTQRQMLNAQNLRFPNPERIPKVKLAEILYYIQIVNISSICFLAVFVSFSCFFSCVISGLVMVLLSLLFYSNVDDGCRCS